MDNLVLQRIRDFLKSQGVSEDSPNFEMLFNKTLSTFLGYVSTKYNNLEIEGLVDDILNRVDLKKVEQKIEAIKLTEKEQINLLEEFLNEI
ncbi:hypothetical protein KC622_03235 [Candidatus Dojkabacteria bacterium]|uniref:Uncharacterized protein n=1 Tax=Candidatus Dojkabacteria bacterium TaxID=2099670 RepID=A0A955KVN7_9BACT|nr:hypothetical protein [Candidatus Dojkabacteria bacterium]MCB9790694.1 hypothetical protein [Candidatus Nomurabacteria bacterium]